jgi:phage gp36-like protein
MDFLEKEELKTVATIAIIDKITAEDNDIVEQIIDESISLMKSYLSRFYDVDAIFSQTGDNRHKHILKILKDIVIYEIYERHTREQNLVAMRRYQEAMAWLEKINTGEFSDLTLPSSQPSGEDGDVSGETGDVRFGSNKKYGSVF